MDPIDRFDKDTPLHKAVRFVNARPRENWEGVKPLVDLLLDAGADPRCDPTPSQRYRFPSVSYAGGLLVRDANSNMSSSRIRNKAKLKPIELVDPANNGLRLALTKAEYAITAGDDIVNRDDDDDANGGAGSASDSD